MRTILLPLTNEATDQHAIQTGLSLANRLQTHLTFLLSRPEIDVVPMYPHSVTAAGYAAMMYDLKTDFDLRETSVERLLRLTAAERGIRIAMRGEPLNDAQASFEVGIGDDDEVVRRFAAVNDMIVFPRKSQPLETLTASSLLKGALEYSGRPVMIITDDLPSDFGRSVAIAWNGSTEGARAVTAALPILSRAEEVIVLTAASGKTKVEEGERLQRYLSHYGVKSRAERINPEGHVGQELISAAADSGAGLFVSGGYTHSRMRQTLFGGVTHHLLENCTLPLLLAH